MSCSNRTDPNRPRESNISRVTCSDGRYGCGLSDVGGAMAAQRNGDLPYLLEAVNIGGDHVTAIRFTEAEHTGTSCGNAVGMLVDEELTVSAVDRVIQLGLM